MPSNLTVVLVSGGINSAVAAALAAQQHSLALLHIQYGQKAAEPETQAFRALCRHLRPMRKQVVSLGSWRDVSNSARLAGGPDMEDAAAVGDYQAATFVPMLSPAMLCLAAGWASNIGATRVLWGINHDNPGHYSDHADAVRLLAWQLAQRALPEGKAPAIEAPLIHYTKQAVVELALELKIPLEQTWSCLRGGPEPCNRCLGCVTRNNALTKAGTAKP